MQSFRINNTVIISSKFQGGIFHKYLGQQLGNLGACVLPPFFEKHILMHWLSILVCFLEGMMPPLYRQQGSLFMWGRSILHQKGRLLCPSFQHRGYLPVSLSPILFGLAYHDSVPWLVTSLLGFHYPPVSMGIDIIPSALHMCSFQSLQPNHITCGLHPSSVDTPVDVHGRSCNFPFIHPKEALLVGHQVTTLPLSSCGVLFISPSYRGSLARGGTSTPVLCMMAAHTQHQSLMWLMTFCIGSSLHKRGCQPWFDAPPPKSLLPTYPWSSSFPSRHLPSLGPGHQISGSLHLFSVIVPFLSACFCSRSGLCLPQGSSQSIPHRSYVHVHMLSRGLSCGGLIAANGGEDKVDQEPRPPSKHQIVLTVPSKCGSGGIVGMHYFSQMTWPVGFFVFSQLPDHVHNHLVWSLYQPVCLGVVGHGL